MRRLSPTGVIGSSATRGSAFYCRLPRPGHDCPRSSHIHTLHGPIHAIIALIPLCCYYDLLLLPRLSSESVPGVCSTAIRARPA